jgi:hypothetical protein
MRHTIMPVLVLVLAAAVLTLPGGCTDKGEGLFGTGPDDRIDRGGGPDTVAVFATADTYGEQTVGDNGSHIIVGSLASHGLEAVSFLRFENLPDAHGELEEVSFVLFSDSEIAAADNYDLRISRLDEAAPSESPFWPGPPDGAEFIDTENIFTEEDTTSTGHRVYFLKIELPVEWVDGWIDDPSSNYGMRLSGGTLDLSSSGNVLPRFRTAGQFSEGSYSLSPRLETKKTDQTDPKEWKATTNFYTHNPTLDPVGDLASMRLGGLFSYRPMLRFPIEGFSELASVNKALLTLKVDTSQPGVNQGKFDVVARAVEGEWSEEGTNVDVKLEAATTPSIEVDADEAGELVLDVTALVEMFTEDGIFNVAILRANTTPAVDGLVLLSSDSPDSVDAPFLRLVFTTPPGGRYSR